MTVPTGVLHPACQVLVLYFGGSWCPHCRNFLPTVTKAFNVLTAELGENVFRFVYVSSDKSAGEFNNYLAQVGNP